MRTKVCSKCREAKVIAEFSKDNRLKSGLKAECKKCSSVRRKERARTKDGLINLMYQSMKVCSNKRGHSNQKFDKKEFKEWLLSKGFDELYENYARTNFDSLFKPSVDRINDFKTYTFDNMQLVTWKENRDKHKPLISNSRKGLDYFEQNSVYRSSFKKACEIRGIDFDDFEEVENGTDGRNKLYRYLQK